MRKLPLAFFALVLTGIFAACGSDGDDDIIAPPGVDGGEGGASNGTVGTSNGSTGTSGTGTSSGSSGTSSGTSGTSDDGGSSGLLDGGTILDGSQVCIADGQNCGLATDCCSRTCDKPAGVTIGKCGAPIGGGGCFAPGAKCTSSTDCCTVSCVSGTCSATQCKADSPVAEACTTDAECCSGKCDTAGTKKCVAIAGGSCRTEGNTCSTNSDCCSNQCDPTKHCKNVSFCSQEGDVCANDFECCGGDCTKASGATLGRCSTIGTAPCNPAGSVCAGAGCDNKCCSLSCGPLGTTGVNICQPPSGCKPQDELCTKSSDCCGGPGNPVGRQSNGNPNEVLKCEIASGDTRGRCESAQCLRPGAVCKAPVGACGGTSNNCCESQFADGGAPNNGFCNDNPEACCSRDALGIPRCRAVNFVCQDGGTVPAGQLCATSADCCGSPCIDNKCQAKGSCQQQGNSCTNAADCCTGLPCVQVPGSTKGYCGGTLLPDGGVIPDSGTSSSSSSSSSSSGSSTSSSSSGGTCGLYGQTCAQNSDCCNGVPCTAGRCRLP